MIRTLRGHHLLCIHGFRGMGYSDLFAENMKKIVDEIRDESLDFPIQVKTSLDDACSACPHNGESICAASPFSQFHVTSMDQRVLQKLGLKAGETYLKSDLIQLTALAVQPDDLDVLCAGCSWLSYGVCKKGIANLREGNLSQK